MLIPLISLALLLSVIAFWVYNTRPETPIQEQPEIESFEDEMWHNENQI